MRAKWLPRHWLQELQMLLLLPPPPPLFHLLEQSHLSPQLKRFQSLAKKLSPQHKLKSFRMLLLPLPTRFLLNNFPVSPLTAECRAAEVHGEDAGTCQRGAFR